ncbi:fucose 4-O-acetylase-like acetyltransferase [Flavobacterium sp. CG_9.1]|uniref:acyltransferase family protein n=1 Tax=Flavobacterium sp. CG_9.1 TaxID=2787728 RepID=UPI0018CA70D1|nr:fucose 4-O-acetylase-like acetyltransferase [Flavobacterium sp. CG_9.1]
MKQRLYWIDNIKAFCIIAVVISHVNSFVLHNSASFINQVIDTFFMGGFFMVSGYLASKNFSDQVSWKSFVQFKTYDLLIPLVIVGTLYALITDLGEHGGITSNPFVHMITNGDQLGYWFLLTLFIFKIMSMLTGLLAKSLRLQYHKIIHKALYILIYIVLGGGVLI